MQQSKLGVSLQFPSVLVIDDSRDFADSLATMLEGWGCRAYAAYDGCTGVELADAIKPNAILVDLRMPRTSGFDTCLALRGLPWSAETVILAVTGSSEEQEAALTDAGFDGVFMKPVEIKPLQELLAWLRLPRHGSGGITPSSHRVPHRSPSSTTTPT